MLLLAQEASLLERIYTTDEHFVSCQSLGATYHFDICLAVVNHLRRAVVAFSLPPQLTTTSDNIYDFVCTHLNLCMERRKNPLLPLALPRLLACYALPSQFIHTRSVLFSFSLSSPLNWRVTPPHERLISTSPTGRRQRAAKVPLPARSTRLACTLNFSTAHRNGERTRPLVRRFTYANRHIIIDRAASCL